MIPSRLSPAVRPPSRAIASPGAKVLPAREERKRVLIPACVWLPNGQLGIPCKVMDVSGKGAGVLLMQSSPELQSACQLTDQLVLVFRPDRVEIRGAIRWRVGDRFGLQFMSCFTPTVRDLTA